MRPVLPGFVDFLCDEISLDIEALVLVRATR
jgi:hypothetical protein